MRISVWLIKLKSCTSWEKFLSLAQINSDQNTFLSWEGKRVLLSQAFTC